MLSKRETWEWANTQAVEVGECDGGGHDTSGMLSHHACKVLAYIKSYLSIPWLQ